MSHSHYHPFPRLGNVPGLQNAAGLVVNGVVDVLQDVVINAPLWVFGIIRPLAGVTVTINGPLIAGGGQIFDLSAGGIIAGNPEVERVLVNWWGADPDGVEDSAPAINAAIAFCTGDYKPRVEHLAGRYRCDSTIVKPHSFHMPIIQGVGGGSNRGDEPAGTVWDFEQSNLGDGVPCVYVKGGSGAHTHGGIANIQINGNGRTIGLQFADQCGAYANNLTILGQKIGVEFYNEHGFTEWCKVVGTQVHLASLYAYHFRRGNGTESFHGAEILDCWSNLAGSSPAGVFIDDGCKWYNGTCRLRVFFADGLQADQYAIASAPASGRWPVYPLDCDGYLKTEGGGGHGVCADFNRPYNFIGPVLALTGIRYGGLSPKWWTMGIGPEGGAANGMTNAPGQPFSFGPRAITVDAAGRWYTGINAGGGNVTCEITVSAANYEYRISGTAKHQGYGGEGHWQPLDVWQINNSRGFGPPEFSVDKNGNLFLTNGNYPPGEVQFYCWYEQTSTSIQAYQRFATMAD